MKKLFYICILIFFTNCSIEKQIVDKPIVFDEERIALTKEYLKNRYHIDNDSISIRPQIIVLHWTAIPTFKGSYNAFYNSKLPNSRPDIKDASSLNVSAHFLVDQDGTIYRLMPEKYMARHVIGLNHCAIGIENVGGTADTPLTKKQLKSNIKLVTYLTKKYNIEYLIGHYEYTSFENHTLWLENNKAYRTKKTDPGEDFMNAIRKATKNLNFTPVPLQKHY